MFRLAVQTCYAGSQYEWLVSQAGKGGKGGGEPKPESGWAARRLNAQCNQAQYFSNWRQSLSSFRIAALAKHISPSGRLFLQLTASILLRC
jgi:hypothetical protein